MKKTKNKQKQAVIFHTGALKDYKMKDWELAIGVEM